MSETLSKEKQVNKIYSKIAGIIDPETGIAQPGTGIAQPGDLFFFITNFPNKTFEVELNYRGWEKTAKNWLRPWVRCRLGFTRDDFDRWHVGIYFMGRKRKDHQRINLWLFNSHPPDSKRIGGVHIQQISPRDFTSDRSEVRVRMEILEFGGISKEQRKRIVEFLNSRLGLRFDSCVVRHALLTYIFGVPNLLHDQNKFSCQQLVTAAYEAAGIYFPHPEQSFPIYNIARFLGRPLGHPRDRVNPKFPYLMDHHIYRDPRFHLKAVIYQNAKKGELIMETENLEKYSWNKALRKRYFC